MKKLGILSVAVVLLLTGCKDAKVAVTEQNKVIAKVGNVNITKDQVAKSLESYKYAATLDIVKNNLYAEYLKDQNTIDQLVTKKVEEVKERSKKANISWEEVLKNAQTTEEEYKNDVILPSVKAELLTKKYLNDEFNDIIGKFGLVKFEILEATNEENAKKAVNEIKAGKSFQDAAKNFGTTIHFPANKPLIAFNNSTTVEADVYSFISQLRPNEVRYVKASSGTNYVVKLVANNVESFKEEAIDALLKSPVAINDAFTHYITKHKIKIHDIDVYKEFEKHYKSALIK